MPAGRQAGRPPAPKNKWHLRVSTSTAATAEATSAATGRRRRRRRWRNPPPTTPRLWPQPLSPTPSTKCGGKGRRPQLPAEAAALWRSRKKDAKGAAAADFLRRGLWWQFPPFRGHRCERQHRQQPRRFIECSAEEIMYHSAVLCSLVRQRHFVGFGSRFRQYLAESNCTYML